MDSVPDVCPFLLPNITSSRQRGYVFRFAFATHGLPANGEFLGRTPDTPHFTHSCKLRIVRPRLVGDAFPCSPQGLGIEPGGSRPTSNTELFKPVSIVGGIYSSGLTSHPEKIFRENESNANMLSVGNGRFSLKMAGCQRTRCENYPKQVVGLSQNVAGNGEWKGEEIKNS